MQKFSACLEWLFAEPGDRFTDRIERAAAAGFEAFEFWLWSNKDIDAIARTARDCDIKVAGLVAVPLIAITNPANRTTWLDGLEESIAVAEKLDAPMLIAQTGDDLPHLARRDQRDALIGTLTAAADLLAGTGVRLAVEPLNTKVDHPGYYLASTLEGFEIVEMVNRPEIGLLFDLYHSAVMGEAIDDELTAHIDRILHVHVADHPGRNDPGSGTVPLSARLQTLFDAGYSGLVGLEYKPLEPQSAAVVAVRDRLSSAL